MGMSARRLRSTMTAAEFAALRRSLDLTQRGLAELLGLSLRTIQDLEGGGSRIRPIHVLAIDRVASHLLGD